MGEQNTWIGTGSFLTGIDLMRAQIGGSALASHQARDSGLRRPLIVITPDVTDDRLR